MNELILRYALHRMETEDLDMANYYRMVELAEKAIAHHRRMTTGS